MMYASKALCTSAIARILDEEGFGFDTVSAGEIYTVYKAGVDMSKVLFNGNNKSSREIELALDCKVGRFSVDNFYEAELLNKIAEAKDVKADILLRITPGIECHTHDYIQTGQIDSKFGFDLAQVDEIVNKIISTYKNLNLRGLHAHIGSQIFELKSYYDEVEILVKEIARINEKYNLNLDEMNMGGGLGVKYIDTDQPPSISTLAEAAPLLNEAGIKVQVVSAPSEGLFFNQSKEYQESVIPSNLPVFGLTAGLPSTLARLVGKNGVVWGLEHFGHSAPYQVLDEKLGFTTENVLKQVKALLKK